MTVEEKIAACEKFYEELCTALSDHYENIPSCNGDMSAYLVPKGLESQLSYYGKPSRSFRISDHWNWYSSHQKCALTNYIQCYCVDAPYAKKRPAPGKASKPVSAIQVAFYGNDNRYHVMFGEIYDRKKKTWSWKNGTIEQCLALAKAAL